MTPNKTFIPKVLMEEFPSQTIKFSPFSPLLPVFHTTRRIFKKVNVMLNVQLFFTLILYIYFYINLLLFLILNTIFILHKMCFWYAFWSVYNELIRFTSIPMVVIASVSDFADCCRKDCRWKPSYHCNLDCIRSDFKFGHGTLTVSRLLLLLFYFFPYHYVIQCKKNNKQQLYSLLHIHTCIEIYPYLLKILKKIYIYKANFLY